MEMRLKLSRFDWLEANLHIIASCTVCIAKASNRITVEKQHFLQHRVCV